MKPWTPRALACCLVLLASSEQTKARIMGQGGTLVVLIATKGDVVICGDRRQYDRVHGDVDSTIKIRNIGQGLVMSATGTVAFGPPDASRIEFDAPSISESWLQTHTLSGTLSS